MRVQKSLFTGTIKKAQRVLSARLLQARYRRLPTVLYNEAGSRLTANGDADTPFTYMAFWVSNVRYQNLATVLNLNGWVALAHDYNSITLLFMQCINL
jgi:hypothetical protein